MEIKASNETIVYKDEIYNGSHRFHGKTKKQRRHLRKATMVSAGDFRRIRAMLTGLK